MHSGLLQKRKVKCFNHRRNMGAAKTLRLGRHYDVIDTCHYDVNGLIFVAKRRRRGAWQQT